ncbi:hypothetical protein BGZ76_004121, partial [Entomortierella beljakovae]
ALAGKYVRLICERSQSPPEIRKKIQDPEDPEDPEDTVFPRFSVKSIGPVHIPNRINLCIRNATELSDILALFPNGESAPFDCNGPTDILIIDAESLETSRINASKIIVPGLDSGPQLDRFVQKNSRWMIDIKGGNWYEILTSVMDNERVALQKELDSLQHRCTNFFHAPKGMYGLGSNWHTLGMDLAYSLFYNMTLIPTDKYKSLIPATSCTEADMQRAFHIQQPETNYTELKASTINYDSPELDLWTLMTGRDIIKPEFKDKGHFWWRSMLTYYITRPTYKIREGIRNGPTVKMPCMSIHVRHSDKDSEAQLLDFAKYMEKAEEVRSKTGVTSIYLMSDDPKVIESSKSSNYSHFQYSSLNMERSNKGWQEDAKQGLSLDVQEEKFLLDVYSAAHCQHNILTYSSNVGRLIGELSYAIHNAEPSVISLDEPWKMDP